MRLYRASWPATRRVRNGCLAAGIAFAVAAVQAGCDGGDEPSGRRPGGDPRAVKTGASSGKSPIPDLIPLDPGESGSADADYGRDLYLFSCATCHGTNGQGLPLQGADLRFSAFIRDHNDEGLVDYLRTGRAADDPQNKLGVAMPARGNPQLTDEQLPHVVAYLRELQAEAGVQESGASAGPRGASVARGREPTASSAP